MVVTTLFSARLPGGRPGTRRIVVGQYAGFAAIVIISLLAALGLRLVPDHAIRWLGLVPLALGVRALLRLRPGDDEPPIPPVTTVAGIALLTLANGADNVGVYTPLFRRSEPTAIVLTCATFAVLVGVWCGLGSTLGNQRHVRAALDRVGKVLVPLLYVAIGLVILTHPS